MDGKEIIDIDNIKEEFEKLNQRLKIINDRFQAISLDYKFYIDGSWGQEQIFELRDSTKYRLYSSQFHIELLVRQHGQIEYDLEQRYKKDPEYFSRRYVTGNPLYEFYGDQVSSILDSIIFHAASLFDYIATLSNYVCGNDKLDKFKWTKLTKSVRDPGNNYSKTKIASVVTQVDRDFVGKLYDYRSRVIHYKNDPSKYYISKKFSQTGIKFIPRFMIGDDLVKEFSYLKQLSKSKQVTSVYAAFWLLNQTLDKVNDLLFALKDEMESNPKIKIPTAGSFDPMTKRIVSSSAPYWKIQ